MNGERIQDTRVEDLLAAYELGLLEAAQICRFEAATLEKPDLLEDLYAMAPHIDMILRHPELAHMAVCRELAGARPSFKDRLQHWTDRIFRIRVLLPATLAVVLAVMLFNMGERSVDLGSLVSIKPLAYVQVDMRAGETDRGAAFHRAMVAYIAADYQGTIDGLTALLAEIGDDPTWIYLDQARLYLGVSYLLLAKPVLAETYLKTGTTSYLPPIADGSKWYLAQSRLLQNDATTARRILVDLGTNSPVYASFANDLLAGIDRLSNR